MATFMVIYPDFFRTGGALRVKEIQVNSDMPHGSLMAPDKVNTAETVFFDFIMKQLP